MLPATSLPAPWAARTGYRVRGRVGGARSPRHVRMRCGPAGHILRLAWRPGRLRPWAASGLRDAGWAAWPGRVRWRPRFVWRRVVRWPLRDAPRLRPRGVRLLGFAYTYLSTFTAERALRRRDKHAARMRSGPWAEWPALPEAAHEDALTRTSDGTLLPVAWRVSLRLREAALVASGMIAERRRRTNRAREAAAQRLGTTRHEQKTSERRAQAATRQAAVAQEGRDRQVAEWAAGATARGSTLRKRGATAPGREGEVEALLTAAEEGDREARGRLSAVWGVRVPLAFFHDDVEDWSGRREHVYADIVGYTEGGEMQVQPVGRVVGCKVRRVVGGRQQRAEYTQWELCTLTWRELRGAKRYGRHRVACEMVTAADAGTASGDDANTAADSDEGGTTKAAKRQRARDRAHARQHAQGAGAASEDGESSDAAANGQPMATSAAPQRRRRATLAEVLSQSVMGTEAWRQLRASGADGQEEEDRGAGAVRYRPPGPAGYGPLSGCESAARATTPAIQAADEDAAFTPLVRRAHPTRGTPVKAPATRGEGSGAAAATPPRQKRRAASEDDARGDETSSSDDSNSEERRGESPSDRAAIEWF